MKRTVIIRRTRRGLRFVPISDEELYAAPAEVWAQIYPLPQRRRVAPVLRTTGRQEDGDER